MCRPDPDGSTYSYNVRNKVASMTDQLGKVEIYSYDKMDNLISVKDRKGQTTNFSYDMLNRITKTLYADSTSTSYFYDAVGRLNTVADTGTGMIQYVYSNTGCSACGGSAVDKIIQEITSLGSISYTYDAIGKRTSMTVAGQPTVNYSYDANSRLTNLKSGLLNFGFSYDAIGRRMSLTRPNGITTNYNYDTGSHLLNIESLNPLNAILEKISYSYDANGNRTSMDRLNASVKLPAPASGITLNSANQMLSFTPAASSPKTITYDANGNLETVTTSCGTTTYTWNARNQLVAIDGLTSTSTCSPLAASFKYDALGRRIEKKINGKTISYLYDGLDVIQEIEDGTVTANYVRTLNIDEPLARVKSDGTVRYYQADALGSIIGLTDESGVIKTAYIYEPFGNIEMLGEPSDNPFQYTGRENDETGLYYYRARHYSPELQRFISEDPIGLTGGINQLAYVNNKPTRYRDPFGLAPLLPAPGGPGAYGGGPGHTAGQLLGWYAGAVYGAELGASIGMDMGFGSGLLAGPGGSLVGGVIGGFIGGAIGGFVGGATGGAFGGYIGGQFDPACAGSLNCNEDQDLAEYYKRQEKQRKNQKPCK